MHMHGLCVRNTHTKPLFPWTSQLLQCLLFQLTGRLKAVGLIMYVQLCRCVIWPLCSSGYDSDILRYAFVLLG